MEKLKSGLLLGENETLVMELEAELWATSSDLISKLIGKLRKLFALILGIRRNGYIVITDKRVVEVSQRKALWVFNVGKNVRYVLPSSVKEVGYTKEGTCLGMFCQVYNLYYDSFTQCTAVQLPVSTEKDAQDVVDAFYKAINAAQ